MFVCKTCNKIIYPGEYSYSLCRVYRRSDYKKALCEKCANAENKKPNRIIKGKELVTRAPQIVV